VTTVMREVASSMSVLAARSGIRIVLHTGTVPIMALARPTDVKQMLINLVSNGLMHAGGGATVQLGAGSLDGMAWIEVTDDGAGMPSTLIERLETGEPLDIAAEAATAGRVRLGLTLTHALAAGNGGRLEIQSTSDGTRARVILPAAP